MIRRNQPHEDLEERNSIQRNSSCKVLAMRRFKQKRASQHGEDRRAVSWRMRSER